MGEEGSGNWREGFMAQELVGQRTSDGRCTYVYEKMQLDSFYSMQLAPRRVAADVNRTEQMSHCLSRSALTACCIGSGTKTAVALVKRKSSSLDCSSTESRTGVGAISRAS